MMSTETAAVQGIFLELDAANHTLRIESEQDTRALSLKLGYGRFEFMPLYGTKTEEKWRRGSSGTVTLFDAGLGMKTGTVTAPTEGRWEKLTYQNLTGFMRITFFQLDPTLHFYQQWANHPDTNWRYAETTIATFELRSRAARALQRWVHAHRHVLIPSEKVYRAKWERSCKQLLEECRQSMCVRKLKKPLEVFDYSTAPAIRYLAIGEKGEVCLKALEGNIFHELDLGQVQGEGSSLVVVLPNGWKERFTLKGAQVSQLHGIRREWQKRQARTPAHRTEFSEAG